MLRLSLSPSSLSLSLSVYGNLRSSRSVTLKVNFPSFSSKHPFFFNFFLDINRIASEASRTRQHFRIFFRCFVLCSGNCSDLRNPRSRSFPAFKVEFCLDLEAQSKPELEFRKILDLRREKGVILIGYNPSEENWVID